MVNSVKEVNFGKGDKIKNIIKRKKTNKMNQISLAEMLFEETLVYFNQCKKDKQRSSKIIMGFGEEGMSIHRLISEVDKSIIDPQLNRMIKLSGLILEEWNKEIYQLDIKGEVRCINFNDDYTVSIKNKVVDYGTWSQIYTNTQVYPLDKLIDYANQFNGYCKLKLKKQA